MIFVAQKDELMLLTGPKAAHALTIELDDAKREEILVQHDDFILIGVFGELVTQGKQ